MTVNNETFSKVDSYSISTTNDNDLFEKLNKLFLTPGLTLNERQEAARRWLDKNEKNPEWLLNLFKIFPKEIYPIIFIHFKRYVYWGSLHDGEFNWLNHLEEWIEIGSYTLINTFNNPLLEYSDEDSYYVSYRIIQTLYDTTTESNTLEPILQKFINSAPFELVFPCLNKLSMFAKNRSEFLSIINSCFQKHPQGKILLLQKLLKNSPVLEKNRHPVIKLEYVFWKEPFLKNPKEISQVAIPIINETGLQFFRRGCNDSIPLIHIFLNIKEYDFDFCQTFFINGVVELDQGKGPKISALLTIIILYENLGIDAIGFLKANPSLKAIIQKWFLVEDLSPCHSTLVGLKLIQMFNEERFKGVFFEKIKSFITPDSKSINTSDFFPFIHLMSKILDNESLLQLFRQNFTLYTRFTNVMRHDIFYLISSYSSSQMEFKLIAELVPDWKNLLALNIEKELKETKDLDFHENTFFEHYNLLKSLKKIDQLEGVKAILFANATSELAQKLIPLFKSLENPQMSL